MKNVKQIRKTLESVTDRDALKNSPHVPVAKFGKDHWSLLAYIETVVVDNDGFIDGAVIRVNENSHAFIDRGAAWACKWQESYGTRLRGFFRNENDSTLRLKQHDDIDCMEDMEAENLVTLGTTVSGFVQLTEKGLEFAEALRRHKADGGSFATFEDSPLCLSLLVKYAENSV